MRLALMLLRKKSNPNGHIYRGKNRLVKSVFPEALQDMKNYFRIEEENMFFLRHPYLSAEQSQGHARALGLPDQKFLNVLNEKRLKFKEDVTLQDRLGHLRHSEPWD